MLRLSGYLIASILILFAVGLQCAACEAESQQTAASIAAESEKAGKPGIHYKPVPPELEKQITDNLATLAKDLPLSAEDAALVREAVSNLDWKWTHRNTDQRGVLRRFDGAAIPVISEFLNSQDRAHRRKGVTALLSLVKSRGTVSEFRSVSETALVALFRRSTLDNDFEIRRLATGALYRMGKARYPDIPEDIKVGLEEVAESAPDPKIRDEAQEFLEGLGLAPDSGKWQSIGD